MSESTDELNTAVKAARESLTAAENDTEELSNQATEMAEEASSHGWTALAARVQDAADGLKAAAAHLAEGGKNCETAAKELGLITDKIPAEAVAGHLDASTTQLGEAVTSLVGAVAKAEEARQAAAEVGQESLMQATEGIHSELTELQVTVTTQQATSQQEKDAADLYLKKQLGN